MSGEDKISLLKEYGISQFGKNFPRMLPPIQLKGHCFQCKSKLLVYRRARTVKHYTCIKCKYKFLQQEQNKNSILLDFELDNNTPSITYNKLSLRDKFYLCSLLSTKNKLPHYLIDSYSESSNFINSRICPTPYKSKAIVSELAFKNFIGIDFESNFNKTYLANIKDKNSINILNIYWKAIIIKENSLIYSQKELLEKLKEDLIAEFLNKNNKENVYNILIELQIEELKQFADISLASIGIEEELPKEAMRKVLFDGLEIMSMAVIRYFIYLCVKNICFTNVNSLSKNIVINTIPKTIKTYIERSISENWNIKVYGKPRHIVDSDSIILMMNIFNDTNYDYFKSTITQYLKDKQD